MRTRAGDNSSTDFTLFPVCTLASHLGCTRRFRRSSKIARFQVKRDHAARREVAAWNNPAAKVSLCRHLRCAIMLPENRPVTERRKLKFRKGQSGNPGGRPKVLGEVQELARQHAPTVIVELARLALRAKSETARIAAIRELLDRGYGRPRQVMEVSVPADNPLQLLLDEIDVRERIEPPVSHTPDRDHLSPASNLPSVLPKGRFA